MILKNELLLLFFLFINFKQYWGFPGGSEGKASACNAGDPGSIPVSERSPGEGNGNPLQYPCLEKSHGWRSLVGYSPWGHKESDTTEQLHFKQCFLHNQRQKFELACLYCSTSHLSPSFLFWIYDSCFSASSILTFVT